MNADDAGVVARDPTLLGLRWLLAPDRLPGMAPDWFAGVDGLRVTYFQYKPATKATVVVTGRASSGETVLWTLRAYDASDDAKFRHDALRVARDGGGALEALRLTIQPFPADPAMPALAPLVRDPLTRLGDLSPAVAAVGERLRIRPLRYKPERRFVARVDDGDRPVAVVRVYPPDGFGGVYDGWKRLGLALGGGRVLGRSTSRGTLLVAWLPGVPMSMAPSQPEHLHAVGVALARLHALRPPRAWRSRLRPAPADVPQAAAALARLLPSEAARIARLAARVPDVSAVSGVVHGDLNAEQVLLTPEGVTFIDLDEAGVGPRAWDIATFAVDVVRRWGDAAGGSALLEPLWVGYGGRPSGLEGFVAAAYLLRAGRAFRERSIRWGEEARAHLHAAECALEGTW